MPGVGTLCPARRVYLSKMLFRSLFRRVICCGSVVPGVGLTAAVVVELVVAERAAGQTDGLLQAPGLRGVKRIPESRGAE
jgi:hypothetical protein